MQLRLHHTSISPVSDVFWLLFFILILILLVLITIVITMVKISTIIIAHNPHLRSLSPVSFPVGSPARAPARGTRHKLQGEPHFQHFQVAAR